MSAGTKTRILLVEDNEKEISLFRDMSEKIGDMEIIAVTDSSDEALELTESLKPDAVILDLELRQGNGVDYVFTLKEMKLEKRPYIVVTTKLEDQVTLTALRSCGVGFIFSKHLVDYNPRQVFVMLNRMQKFFSYYEGGHAPNYTEIRFFGEEEEKEISYRLGFVLDFMKMSPHLSGYHYLIESVIYAYMYPNKLPEVTGEIYPYVAAKYHTKHTNVEHSIRSAIGLAWSRMDKETKNYYMETIQPAKSKPTNKEMIAYLVRTLRTDDIERQKGGRTPVFEQIVGQ